MRPSTLAGVALAFALTNVYGQAGGPAPETAGQTGIGPGTTTQAAPGSSNTQRGAAATQGGTAGGSGSAMTGSGSGTRGMSSSGRARSTSARAHRNARSHMRAASDRRMSGRSTRAGEERFRRELAECNEFSGDTKRSCVQGMNSARADGLYRD